MRQSAKRFLSSALALILVIAAIFIFFDLIQPVYGEIQTIKAETMGLEDFVSQQSSVIGNVRNLVGVYESSAEARDAISWALPLEPDVAGAMSQLSGIASSSNVVLLSLGVSSIVETPRSSQVQKGIVAKPKNTITLRVRLLGTYEDFKTFLKGVESNMRVFDVKDIALQAAPSVKPNQNLFNFDISVVAYYQNQ